MAAVTAAMVKELREMTGAGMMDCKKALAATDGDMDKAVEFLREKGLAGAAKKAGRIAAEGIVATALQLTRRKRLSLRLTLRQTSLQRTKSSRPTLQTLQHRLLTQQQQIWMHSWMRSGQKDESLTVAEALSSQISIIGENMKIRRFRQVDRG